MDMDDDESVEFLENEGGGITNQIKEGAANIIFTKETFYNPIQKFDRDLTVTVLSVFSEARETQKKASNEQMEHDGEAWTSDKKQMEGGIRILDALSASGLRAIRFALEVPNVEAVLANDFSELAFETIKRNVQLNQLEDRVKPMHSDAIDLMMEHRKFEKRFHAVDLDPYGSASIFLDSAVQAVVDGGILMVTCTDTAILCGNAPEACFNKYGSVPLRHRSCHEIALRILLRSIDSHANRYERFIEPLLSVSVDFYVRCFVRLQSGAAAAKNSVTKLSNVLCCASCQSLDFQPLIRKTQNGNSIRFSAVHFQSNLLRSSTVSKDNSATIEVENKMKCKFCDGTAIHVGGPLYTAPMHDPDFVKQMLNRLNRTPVMSQLGTHERLLGMLTVISEELHDQPLFYEHNRLMNMVKCPVPMDSFRSALLHAGFRCSGSHCNTKAVKTDAPVDFLWDVCRAWARQSKVDLDKLKLDSAGKHILSTPPSAEVNFALHPKAIPPSKLMANLLRFQDNKGKNWSPKKKAKGSISSAKSRSKPVSNGQLQPLREQPMPKTPEHYWDVNFPSPGEQLRRGYIFATDSPLFKKNQAKRRIL